MPDFIASTDFAKAVRDIIAEAGALLTGIYHEFDENTHLLEGGQEAVTIADIEGERLLATRLMQLLPGSIALGEEDLAMRHKLGLDAPRITASDQIWFIDPIDGTRSFRTKQDDWAIMVGLQSQGELIAGWIYFPLRNLWLEGHIGQGATINGQTVKLQTNLNLSQSTVMINDYHLPFRSHGTDARQELLQEDEQEALAEMRAAFAQQHPRGYSCVEMLTLLTGAANIHCHANGLVWDNAAGVAIYRAAGGVVRFLDNAPYRIVSNADVQMKKRGLLYAPSEADFATAAAALAPLRAYLIRQNLL